MTDHHYSAFISHSSQDAAAAAEIAAALERSGLTCWIAPRDVRPGATWADEIIRGINAARCFVLLVSSAANLSDNVLREVERAAAKSKPIYPVRIEDVAPEGRLEYFISMHHWIDALDGLVANHVDRLIAAMERGDRWTAQPRTAAPVVENPFATPLAHDGPILPAPRAAERWESLLGPKATSAISASKPGENGREWTVPETLTWLTDDMLFYGASQRIYRVDVSVQHVELAFSVPRWRERYILDFAGLTRSGDILVLGNTFRRTMLSPKWSSETYGYVSETEDHINPDWGRVVPHPAHPLVLETGLVTGKRSGNVLKRFFAIPDGYNGDRYRFTVTDPRGRKPVASWSVHALLGSNYSVSWSPTGNYLGLCSTGFDILVLPVEDHPEPIDGHAALPDDDRDCQLSKLAWHPTRDIYATSWNRWGGGKPDAFGFYVADAANGQVLHDRTLDRRARATALDWSADGRFLALGGEDQAIYLWDFERDRAEILLGHTDYIRQVHFSPDGQRLLSSDTRQTLLWDPRRPSGPILTVPDMHLTQGYAHRINGMPWSPDGRKFAGFGWPGRIRVMGLA